MNQDNIARDFVSSVQIPCVVKGSLDTDLRGKRLVWGCLWLACAFKWTRLAPALCHNGAASQNFVRLPAISSSSISFIVYLLLFHRLSITPRLLDRLDRRKASFKACLPSHPSSAQCEYLEPKPILISRWLSSYGGQETI